MGLFLGAVCLVYAPVRFVLDFLRVWPRSEAGDIDVNGFVQFFLDILHVQPEAYVYGGDARYFGLTPAQYVSIGIFIAGVIIFAKIRNNPPMEWERFKRPAGSDRKDEKPTK
jgi:hypothetical protein